MDFSCSHLRWPSRVAMMATVVMSPPLLKARSEYLPVALRDVNTIMSWLDSGYGALRAHGAPRRTTRTVRLTMRTEGFDICKPSRCKILTSSHGTDASKGPPDTQGIEGLYIAVDRTAIPPCSQQSGRRIQAMRKVIRVTTSRKGLIRLGTATRQAKAGMDGEMYAFELRCHRGEFFHQSKAYPESDPATLTGADWHGPDTDTPGDGGVAPRVAPPG